MRKQVFGRRLKRDTNERKALFKGLLSALVLEGSIKTTEAKAKAIKGAADKLITKAKRDQQVVQRLLSKELTPVAIDKLVKQIAPRFDGRHGGYTRIIRLGRRASDSSSMVLIQWIDIEKWHLKDEQTALQSGEKKETASKEKTDETETAVKADLKKEKETKKEKKPARKGKKEQK